MIDVHPARHAATTWREFLIHLATIVIGLLIAIGLEQTVVWIHHRGELLEARHQLSSELREKQHLLEMDKEQFSRINAELAGDMAILVAHRDEHSTDRPNLNYSWQFYGSPQGTWESVRQNGSLTLMPREELQRYQYAYDLSRRMQEAASSFLTETEITQAIANRSPDGKLSQRDIDELITATSECQGKLAFAENLLSSAEAGLNDSSR